MMFYASFNSFQERFTTLAEAEQWVIRQIEKSELTLPSWEASIYDSNWVRVFHAGMKEKLEKL